MKHSCSIILALAILFAGCRPGPADVKVGRTLPGWQQGWLDIHSINTGRGESYLYILPDGTTMLVDASGARAEEIVHMDPPGVPSRPSYEISPGSVINRYLDKYLPAESEGKIDYFMLSHYHGDHMGLLPKKEADFVYSSDGSYAETSLSEIGEVHPFRRVIDRGPFDNRASAVYFNADGRRLYANYLKFLAWSTKKNGTVHEALQVGRDDQITLTHDPDAYPGFSVRNIAAGGNVWTGEGFEVDSTWVPSAAECLSYGDSVANKLRKGMPKINENIFSCVFQLRYGKFDWYSGGDVQHKHRSEVPWFDMELPISKVVRPVDAMKMSHHGTLGANSPEICRALKPNVAIASGWRDVHPNPKTIKCLIKASPDVRIITTNMTARNEEVLASSGIDMDRFIATGGHAVIRVEPGGSRYYVFVLDDGDFRYRVKAIAGPYDCTD